MDAGVGHRPGGQQRSTTRETRSKLEEPDSPQPAAAHACFDCNICLDFAVEPVVTLCGHLYCWPCIYKWLRQESTDPQQCPVCKAALSPTTLVPLYGRGYSGGCKDAHRDHDIPRRPPTSFTARAAETTAQQVPQHEGLNPHRRRRPHGNYMLASSSTTTRLLPPTMLGGTAIAVLPWVLGDEWMGSSYLGSHHLIGGSNSPRLRRQEMQDRMSLHRISIFFLCCLALCLLVF